MRAVHTEVLAWVSALSDAAHEVNLKTEQSLCAPNQPLRNGWAALQQMRDVCQDAALGLRDVKHSQGWSSGSLLVEHETDYSNTDLSSSMMDIDPGDMRDVRWTFNGCEWAQEHQKNLTGPETIGRSQL